MKKIIKFLKKNNAYFENINSEKYIKSFINEMKKGLCNKKSSLKMLPTYIDISNIIPLEKKIIAIDAGGTNLRTAEIYFDKNKFPVIKNLTKSPMPGSDKEINKNEFFDILSEKLKKNLNASGKIGFCFSYPTEMFPDKDGKLIVLSKEINVKNLVGEMIGANLNKKIEELGFNKKNIVILNDTTSTLLSGLVFSAEKKHSTYIGFILGTGTNLCYIEKNINIKKNPGLDPIRKQIINIEAGNFNKFPKSTFDKEVDKTTIDKGFQLFEKMASGRYFGLLCLFMLREAAGEKMFSDQTSNTLKNIKEITTAQINDFLNNENQESNVFKNILKTGDSSDEFILKELFNSIIERNAKLAAIVLSAVILKIQEDNKIDLPVCISAEGTTFYKLKNLKEKTEKYLYQILTEEHNIKYEIVNIPDAALLGAAIAGLLN